MSSNHDKINSPEEKLKAVQQFIFNQYQGRAKFSKFAQELGAKVTEYLDSTCCAMPELKKYNVIFLRSEYSLTKERHVERILHHFDKLTLQSEKKNICLVLSSDGGDIDAAFLISKLCGRYVEKHNDGEGKFVVAVPRRAKSAATLLALGADEIHMGRVSELGPIDPQINNLPALGVQDALDMLLDKAVQYPQSGAVISDFLSSTINMHVLGWLVRLPQAAFQYACQLLARHNEREIEEQTQAIQKIAYTLIHTYKHHGFVIDDREAQKIFSPLNKHIIQINTPLIKECEKIHNTLLDIEGDINIIWQDPKHRLSIEVVGSSQCVLIPVQL